MKPYRNKKVNVIRIVSEVFYTVASVLLVTLPFLEQDEYLSIYKTIGWSIVILFIFVEVLEMISLILIKKKDLKKTKKKIKKKEKITLK